MNESRLNYIAAIQREYAALRKLSRATNVAVETLIPTTYSNNELENVKASNETRDRR